VKKTFSIAAVALTLIAGGYPIQQAETAYKTVEVGEATVEIERLGTQVSIHVENIPDGGELTVARGSVEVEETSEGVFKDLLPTNSSKGLYTLSLETPVTLDSELVSKGVIEAKNVDAYVNLDVVTTFIPTSEADSQSAYAATALPSRTRFRYQTFISEAFAPAPPLACAPLSTSTVLAEARFLGDNRSWDPDSDSYKTRSDIVVDWGAGGAITPEFSVGETTRITDYVFLPIPVPVTVVNKKTASSEGMKLVRGEMSSDYVSFRIISDVTNPLCLDLATKGISYNFSFYIQREGRFVVKGTMLRVPNHELYTRNNISPSWRNLFQVTNQGFQCLFALSWDCELDKHIAGDLVP
jgi:hypothetical protein